MSIQLTKWSLKEDHLNSIVCLDPQVLGIGHPSTKKGIANVIHKPTGGAEQQLRQSTEVLKFNNP